MLLSDQLKKYVNAMLAYDEEAKDIRDARKSFKLSFMVETGASKGELKILDKAIGIGKKLETSHEVNDFTTFVDKITNMLRKIAPGSENEQDEDDDGECPVPTADTKMFISVNGGPEIETSVPAVEKVTKQLELGLRPRVVSKSKPDWNPPPAPVIPSDGKRKSN